MTLNIVDAMKSTMDTNENAVPEEGQISMGDTIKNLKVNDNPKPQKKSTRSNQSIYKEPVRHSKGVSIDNYDPSGTVSFTDPLTLEALNNLKVLPEELRTPTDADIFKYSRDPKFYDMIKTALEERKERTKQKVIDERDRLSYIPEKSTLERSTFVEQTSDAEEERLARIEADHKREAARMIIQMLIDEEIEKERQAIVKKEHENDKKRQDDAAAKSKSERENSEGQNAKKDEIDRKNQEEREKIIQDSQEREKALLQRKKKYDQEKKEKLHEREEERQKKSEQTIQSAEEKRKEAEQKLWDKIKLEEERIKKIEKEREEKKKHLEEEAKQREKESLEKIEAVRTKQREEYEKKREIYEKKQTKSRESVNLSKQKKKEDVKNIAEHRQQGLERSISFRLKIEEEREEKLKQKEAEKQKKYGDQYKAKKEADQIELQRRAIERQIKLEEALRNSQIITSAQSSQKSEVVANCELRIRSLQEKGNQERKKLMESEKLRLQLLRKKEEAFRKSQESKSAVKSSTGNHEKLEEISQNLGLDFNQLQEQAREQSRFGNRRSLSKPLPPLGASSGNENSSAKKSSSPPPNDRENIIISGEADSAPAGLGLTSTLQEAATPAGLGLMSTLQETGAPTSENPET